MVIATQVLDVDAADRLMRPHHTEALPFEKQLARVDEQADALTADLYYDTDIGVVRPRVRVPSYVCEISYTQRLAPSTSIASRFEKHRASCPSLTHSPPPPSPPDLDLGFVALRVFPYRRLRRIWTLRWATCHHE
jgi:hypothetical protein